MICVSLSACKKEILPPEQVVQGCFAYYDGSKLTHEFLKVHNGHFENYRLRSLAVLANNCIWNYQGEVSLYDQGIYSIVDETLLVKSGEKLHNYGEIRVVEDTLYLGESKFLRVDKMTISPYTSIDLSRYSMVLPFKASEDTLTVKLDRPLPNQGPISVKSSADWLRVDRIQNDVAYIKADALTSKDGPRSAKITFSYPYALDKTVNVVQERIDEASLIRTLEAGVLSPTAVRLNAFLDVEDYPYTTIEKSFYYGTDCNNLNNVTSGGTLSGNVLSKQLQGLTCNTKYYYRAYLKLDDLEVWGEIKTFTTQDVAVSFDEYVSGIGWNNAIIGGRITATPKVNVGNTVTVYYGRAGTALFWKRMATIADDGSFTYLMSNLSSNTEYEWFIEAAFAGAVFRSNTRTFKTAIFDNSAGINLYATWDANPDFEPTPIAGEMDINILIQAPEKIATFVVTVDSYILSDIIAQMGGDTSYSYANDGPYDMDLIGNVTLANTLTSMIPTGDALKGQTEVLFSLSQLVPMIQMFAPTSGSEHIFTLKVSDEKGQTLEKTLVFYVEL